MIHVERRVSLGNLIGLVPLFVALILWIAQLKTDSSALKKNTAQIESNWLMINSHTDMLAQFGARITTLERLANERQSDIIRRLDRIEDKLDQVPLR